MRSVLGAAVDVVRRAQRREAAQARHGGSLGQDAFHDYCRRRSVPRWHEGPQHALICQTLQDAVIAASQGHGEKHMIFEPPRHGKPLAAGTLVLMASGERRAIEQVRAGERVIAGNGQSVRVSAVIEQGPLPVWEITTDAGRFVRAAGDHPFWTTRGWRHAGELSERDVLACVPRPAVVSRDPGAVELARARLAGYIIGDGNVTQGCATVTAGTAEILNYIAQVARDAGFAATVRVSQRRVLLRAGVRAWLREIGLQGTDSRTKHVPAFLFTASREIVAAFLAAYFECDGHVTARGSARDDCCLEFYSVNRQLLMDVQHLLLRVGCQARLRSKRGRYQSAVHHSWRLALTGQDDVAAFAQELPLHGPKRARLAEWSPVPRRFAAPWLPDPIVSIRQDGVAPCYCLTVEGEHTYTANDLVVHNSHTTSVLLPTWTLGTFSSFTVILTMYGGKIATAKGREARNLLRDVGPDEFGVEVSEASAAVGDWSLHKRRGRMISVGFGGPLTGEGGQLLICDDPFKNAEEANSAVMREAKWDWWRTVFETRADFPSATIILLMTRWHEDDLAGRLLKEQGDAREGGEWHVLSLPAESLGPKVDPLKRPKGAPLWPDRWPTRILAKRKEALGPYYWAALYQQSPMPEGGAVFRRSTFQYFYEEHTARGDFYVLLRRTGERGELQEIRVRCEDCWGFCTLDPAFTAKESSDFFAMGHWLVTPAIAGVRYRMLSDVLHLHLEVPDQLPRIESWSKQHGARFVGIEESVGSLGVIQQAERDGRITIRRCKVDRDKQARSAPLAGRYEAGQVFHRQGAEWLEVYERELIEFPRGAHDDLVDMAGHAELLLLSFDALDDISAVSLEQIAPFNLDGPSGRRWE